MKTMTEPTLSLTLTVPSAWEDIARALRLRQGDCLSGIWDHAVPSVGKERAAAYPDRGMGSVWWLAAMSWDNFKELRGYDALPVPEIPGIAEYVLGADDEYVYLLVLPSDAVPGKRSCQLSPILRHCKSTHKGVLTRFLKDNGIHINDMCPASLRIFRPLRAAMRRGATGYVAYDALLAEISDLRRSGAGEGEEQRTPENDAEHTSRILLRPMQ